MVHGSPPLRGWPEFRRRERQRQRQRPMGLTVRCTPTPLSLPQEQPWEERASRVPSGVTYGSNTANSGTRVAHAAGASLPGTAWLVGALLASVSFPFTREISKGWKTDSDDGRQSLISTWLESVHTAAASAVSHFHLPLQAHHQGIHCNRGFFLQRTLSGH